MSRVVWERKRLLPDEANEYDVARKITEAATEFKQLADAAKNSLVLIDGRNKEYLLTVTVEELDS